MFGLVFVSVKLNGEDGSHLPPSLGDAPSWLMAFPGDHKTATRGAGTFRLLDPSAWGPQTPLLPHEEEREWH